MSVVNETFGDSATGIDIHKESDDFIRATLFRISSLTTIECAYRITDLSRAKPASGT